MIYDKFGAVLSQYVSRLGDTDPVSEVHELVCECQTAR